MIYQRCKHFLLIFMLTWHPFSYAISQKTADYKDINNAYQEAVDLFQKQKYSAAQELFSAAINNYGKLNTEYKSNAAYYHAICAVRLYHNNAEFIVRQFINRYPGSQKVVDAKFEMANTYYNQDKYEKSLEWFGTINPHRINEEKQAAYFFKTGYSFFMLEEYDTARTQLFEIINKDTKYTAPAIYYYAHIAYEQENFQTALNNFLKLTDDPTFSPVVPYYISQIYYIQHKYDKIIEYAAPLVDSLIPKRKPEVSRIIGDAYYHKKEFKCAGRYYNYYIEHSDSITARDKYRVAYSYYRLQEYEKAAKTFENIAEPDSTFEQNIMYHLGDCYLQMGQKDKARMAFESASEMDQDSVMTKNALFNYAKLTYELSYSPFNNAINALSRYINTYPDDKNTKEAFNYLVLSYMSTNNFKAALVSIRKIEKKNDQMKKAFQRIAYFRGLELFKNLDFAQAIDLFNESLKYKQYDHLIAAKTYYWKGEALYRTEDYKNAISNYKQFINSTGVFSLDIYKKAHYNMGYAYFKREDYSNANTWFRKYISLSGHQNTKRLADACNRTGDCFFASSEYWQAIDYYDKAAKMKSMSPDYSLFQKAFSFGLIGKNQQKINILHKMLREYPSSNYTDDALFELGKSLINVQKPDSAIQCYLKIIDEYPSSSYVIKAHVQLGLVYYNQDNNDQALKHFKSIVEHYPHSEASKNALTGIKNIFLDMDNADGYFEYVNSLDSYTKVSASERDSLSYTAAENVYMKNDCDKAVNMFNNYLEKFPAGGFILNTHYYMADCYYRNNNFDKALPLFEYVINKPKNTFTEEALVHAAEIYYINNEYEKALKHYQSLEKIAELNKNVSLAKKGRLRCHFKLKDYQQTLNTANELLPEVTSEELKREALFKMAVSNYKIDKDEAALEQFQNLSEEVRSREGAESKYYVAKILYEQEKYEEAKKEVFDYIEKNTPHRYWLAKSFLILADIFVNEDEAFQAVQTLKSLIENYENKNDGIIQEAQQKIDNIQQSNNTKDIINDSTQTSPGDTIKSNNIKTGEL